MVGNAGCPEQERQGRHRAELSLEATAVRVANFNERNLSEWGLDNAMYVGTSVLIVRKHRERKWDKYF